MLKRTMKCPYCSSSSFVTNSRKTTKGFQIWRRRTCSVCAQVWTTVESVNSATTYSVEYPNKRSGSFQRDILFLSIKDALHHRKDAVKAAGYVTSTVLGKIYSQNRTKLPVSLLIELTLGVLKNYDATAAAVYKATYEES
jgi:transcriptional repressor NrdR